MNDCLLKGCQQIALGHWFVQTVIGECHQEHGEGHRHQSSEDDSTTEATEYEYDDEENGGECEVFLDEIEALDAETAQVLSAIREMV